MNFIKIIYESMYKKNLISKKKFLKTDSGGIECSSTIERKSAK